VDYEHSHQCEQAAVKPGEAFLRNPRTFKEKRVTGIARELLARHPRWVVLEKRGEDAPE
jgi:hypothetical protein